MLLCFVLCDKKYLIDWYFDTFFPSCWSDYLRVKVNCLTAVVIFVVQLDDGRGKTNCMCILQSGIRGRIGEDDRREAATTSSTLAEEGSDATIRKRNGTVLAKSFWLQHSAQHTMLQYNVALYISFYPVPNSIQQIMECYPPTSAAALQRGGFWITKLAMCWRSTVADSNLDMGLLTNTTNL